MSRLLLLLSTATYRARDFLDAAAALGAEVVVASERRQALDRIAGPRADVALLAAEVGSPCVVKPVSLSASRGVIRGQERDLGLPVSPKPAFPALRTREESLPEQAQIRQSAEVSPGKRPITFARRRTSTKVRSSRLVERIRLSRRKTSG